ncbi:DUF5317 domain-containing protein [Clostridium sp. YIM B02515]|uniref:DUF5317 domain-containing protein n=1 Tax=Clostridium rhizosphaerae TaxID=2803861 RepID=A0ABS1TDR3_9CLOT|nr:DUF5317 family protein [Clostridium rhizosphaerae]MBL4937212.1 DUF5317 domain-containing protein [Clostridium rhizosphaerae]
MFLLALIIAVIIGYCLKGKLRNIDAEKVKGLYLVFAAFFLEYIVLTLLRKGSIKIGTITLLSDIIMYLMLVIFTYFNRKDRWILILGIGFMLNAIVIFANGGMMPVRETIVRSYGFKGDLGTTGLYRFIDKNTHFVFLSDIIPLGNRKLGIASIGDIVECIGVAGFIIKEMKNRNIKPSCEI